MNDRYQGWILWVFLFLAVPVVCASESGMNVEPIITQMKKDLNLTNEQITAVRPIVKASMENRQAFLENAQGEAFLDKKMFKAMLSKYRDEADRQLSGVLSQDQMKTLIKKRKIREGLNKDKVDFSETLGIKGLNTQGATMAF